ncbi:MAG: hypothetical protein VX777_00800 [Chlamydiota bacterium]|nr:hypothetical protein [Chlamydiota bacterium]
MLSLFLTGCSNSEENVHTDFSDDNIYGEYIFRKHDEHFYTLTPPKPKPPYVYPWEKNHSYALPKINKEYFRCKGCSINPEKIVNENGEIKKYLDCDGIDKHGLPLRDGVEFIYPVLIDVLNFIQEKTSHRVIITSGHRCPEHNTYVDASKDNLYSKHMIGAEVSFYVESLENDPMQIIDIIRDYYKNVNDSDYTDFRRYEKDNTNVRIPPWYNKEIFVKLFQKDEGRDFDNRHPYPYIGIQVRYDRNLNERVSYTWNKANRQFLRK